MEENNCVILSEAVFQAERRISRGAVHTLRAGSLAPLVKARDFGMTHSQQSGSPQFSSRGRMLPVRRYRLCQPSDSLSRCGVCFPNDNRSARER
jgi:hypothetical protein